MAVAVRLPGWERPIRFGMSSADVRQAAGVTLERGSDCERGHRCWLHRGEYMSETDPVNYWVELDFDKRDRLIRISLTCSSPEGCGEDHPLYRFWKEHTAPNHLGSDPAIVVRRDGILWKHYARIGEDSGDLSEDFEILPLKR